MADTDYDDLLPIECIPAPILLPYFPLSVGGEPSQPQSSCNGAPVEVELHAHDPLITPEPPPTEGIEAENRDGDFRSVYKGACCPSLPPPRRRRKPRRRGVAFQWGHPVGLPTRKKHRRHRILKSGLKKAGIQQCGWKKEGEDADIDAEEQRKSFEDGLLERMDRIITQLDKIINMSKCRRQETNTAS